jgi:hypothetical protein
MSVYDAINCGYVVLSKSILGPYGSRDRLSGKGTASVNIILASRKSGPFGGQVEIVYFPKTLRVWIFRNWR